MFSHYASWTSGVQPKRDMHPYTVTLVLHCNRWYVVVRWAGPKPSDRQKMNGVVRKGYDLASRHMCKWKMVREKNKKQTVLIWHEKHVVVASDEIKGNIAQRLIPQMFHWLQVSPCILLYLKLGFMYLSGWLSFVFAGKLINKVRQMTHMHIC